LSSEPDAAHEPLTAVGERVLVRPPTPADETAYVEAVTRSSRRLADFAIPDPHNLPAVLASQSPVYRTFMVIAREPAGDHGLVGRINVANVVRGAFLSATIGYDAYDPYAGHGLFVEGLTLALDLVFADEPTGMALHRVEANIQPANARSAGLVRSLGFVHEGYSRAFLHLPGVDGRRAWRDHDRYTMLASDWPAAPYRPHGHRRVACIVTGAAAYGGTTLAAALALELEVPLYSASTVPETPTLFELLRSSPVGGVVECRASGPELRMGLARAGFDPSVVPVLDTAVDVPKAEVVRRALAVRTAFA
jgi:[ribosomal protein S5]-alanine N-acetyltransferase